MSAHPDHSLPSEARRTLDDLLRRIAFRSEVFYRGQLCDSWALDTSGTGKVSFHIVAYGQCWLHLPSADTPIRLRSGDIVVFPHDAPHVIGSSQNPPARYGVKTITREVPMGRDAPGTALLCGYLEVDRTARQLLLAPLPEHMVIGNRTGPDASQIRTLLDLLFAEASADAVGAVAILDRLSDAVLFYVIREALRQHGPLAGLLGALRDPHLMPAVLAIGDHPESRWTVGTLADRAHLSRSAFADRFLAAVGMPPIEFLTVWRMHLARRWLETEQPSVLEVAERCGYQSEAAFSKAFKRMTGVGPGEYRRIAAIRKRGAVGDAPAAGEDSGEAAG